ncbi:MAG: hypothetical protein ACOZBH_05065 [Patescibacteria group bacterium]
MKPNDAEPTIPAPVSYSTSDIVLSSVDQAYIDAMAEAGAILDGIETFDLVLVNEIKSINVYCPRCSPVDRLVSSSHRVMFSSVKHLIVKCHVCEHIHRVPNQVEVSG